MGNSIPTPRQTFTLKYEQNKIEEIITYIANEMPTYKFIKKNEAPVNNEDGKPKEPIFRS